MQFNLTMQLIMQLLMQFHHATNHTLASTIQIILRQMFNYFSLKWPWQRQLIDVSFKK